MMPKYGAISHVSVDLISRKTLNEGLSLYMTGSDTELECLLTQRANPSLDNFAILSTGVFAFESARNSFTSALVYSRRTGFFVALTGFFVFLAT
jgi:hypothetical protein